MAWGAVVRSGGEGAGRFCLLAWTAGLGLLISPLEDAHALELEIEPLITGDTISLRVRGATPGSTVVVARTLTEPVAGAGACPPSLGGECLDVAAPRELARVVADGQGRATAQLTVPAQLPSVPVWLQAVELGLAVTSPVVESHILGVCSGTYYSNRDNVLAAVQSCGRIEGSLSLYSEGGVVPALPWLVEVTGDLTFIGEPGLTVVEGPPRLRSVGGLGFRDWPDWTSISGFEQLADVTALGLTRVGPLPASTIWDGHLPIRSLGLVEVSWLQDLSAFASLGQLDALELYDLPALASLEGLTDGDGFLDYLLVELAPTLIDFRGLEIFQRLRDVTLFDLAGLERFDGLNQVAEVQSLFAAGLPEVEDFSSLQGLEVLGYLDLEGFDAVSTVSHLEPVIAAMYADGYGTVHLRDFPSLTTLDGIGQTDTLYELRLQNLPSLTSLEALAPVQSMNELDLRDLPALTTGLTGLEGVSGLRELTLDSVASVVDLTALQSLQTFQAEPIIRLERMPSLQSLEGLEALEAARYLYLEYNPVLERLTGLEGLREVTVGFDLQHNTALTDVSALAGVTYIKDLDADHNTSLCVQDLAAALAGASILDVTVDRATHGPCP